MSSLNARDRQYERALDGYAFFVGNNKTVAPTGGGNFRSVLKNTSTNRSMVLYRMELFYWNTSGASPNNTTVNFYLNPTIVPTTAPGNVIYSHVVPGVTTSGEYRADTNAAPISGGVDLQFSFGVLSNGFTDIEPSIFTVPPGVTLGSNIPIANNTAIIQNWYWWEE